jgi:hypothetical protein
MAELENSGLISDDGSNGLDMRVSRTADTLEYLAFFSTAKVRRTLPESALCIGRRPSGLRSHGKIGDTAACSI